MKCPKCGSSVPAQKEKCYCGYNFEMGVESAKQGDLDSMYNEITGWLLFFIIATTIIIPLNLLYNFLNVYEAAGNFGHSDFIDYITFFFILYFFILVYSIRIGISLWQRRQTAVANTKVFIIIYSIFLFVNNIATSFLYSRSTHQTLSGPLFLIMWILMSATFAFVWLIYFNVSERVAAVYGKNDNQSETPSEDFEYVCTECGAQVAAEDTICPSCGGKLDEIVEQK